MNRVYSLAQIDPQLRDIVVHEAGRQAHELNFIASENYCSQAVREAVGSVLTNKYAEGYPGKRYYGGCQFVDQAEILAIERAQKLFHAEYVNVQPHAGSPANMAALAALIKPGDTILGMSLAEGGHLTHGHAVNFSGSWYHAVQYGVDHATGLLDYDAMARLAQQHQPKVIIVGASAYSRVIDFAHCRAIADTVGAYLLVDMAHIAGLVAAGMHPSPFGHAHVVTTTTHKTLRGPRGGMIFAVRDLGAAIDKAIMPGLQGGPFMNNIAGKAVVLLEAQQPDFIDYAQRIVVNSQAMARRAQELGLSVVTGGTDNHMFIIDLRSIECTGRLAQNVLGSIGISVSASCIPGDPEKPWITSGIRLGTPATATRDFDDQATIESMDIIHQALQHRGDTARLQQLADQVKALCNRYPIPERFR
jgi:glycine hydroxymethyltransferase